MKKILFLLQIFLQFFLIYFLISLWYRFLFNNTTKIILFSFITTILIEILIYLFSHYKNKKTSLKLKEQEDADNMAFSLTTLPLKQQLDFYLSLVKTRHNKVNVNDNYIEIIHEENKKTILIPFLKFKELSNDDLNYIYKTSTQIKFDKLVIICNEYDKTLNTFIANFNIETIILDKYEVYQNLYKEYQFFPKITIEYKKEAKKTFKDFLAYSFNKSRSKGYIISSVILFISSFFVKINLYYCIFSSILLIFALISYSNSKYNKKIVKNLL